MAKKNTHLCACWIKESCVILSDGKTIINGVLRDNGDFIGFITACGKKIYRGWYNYVSNCQSNLDDDDIRLTANGNPITCPKCRRLGSSGQ